MSTPKYVVCPACDGEGFVGTLGAYTSDEFDEAFGGDVDEYRAIHEASKVACACCKGRRVATPEQVTDWEEDCAYEAERAAERRFGC